MYGTIGDKTMSNCRLVMSAWLKTPIASIRMSLTVWNSTNAYSNFLRLYHFLKADISTVRTKKWDPLPKVAQGCGNESKSHYIDSPADMIQVAKSGRPWGQRQYLGIRSLSYLIIRQNSMAAMMTSTRMRPTTIFLARRFARWPSSLVSPDQLLTGFKFQECSVR